MPFRPREERKREREREMPPSSAGSSYSSATLAADETRRPRGARRGTPGCSRGTSGEGERAGGQRGARAIGSGDVADYRAFADLLS